MIGLNNVELAAVPQELKEAVCNALVNMTVARVSGTDGEGRVLYGRSPRRSIVSGQLLPRFDPTGQDDETSDIRIAAIGMDFVVQADARGHATVRPSFSVYVRVLPEWHELADEVLGLEIDFRIRTAVQDVIDQRIRQLRTERFASAGLTSPDWPNLNPEQRQRIKVRRSQIEEEVRRQAYLEQGIALQVGDEQLVIQNDGNDDADSDAQQHANGGAAAHLQIGRLLQRGRTVPFGLLEPAQIPPKWRRIDLNLPVFGWGLGTDPSQLRDAATRYSDNLRQVARQQVADWLSSPEGRRDAWRDLRVQPLDVSNEGNWLAFRARAEQVTPSLTDLMPAIDGVAIEVEVNRDFADPRRAAVRVMLDNGSSELSRRQSAARTDTIFNTGLEVVIPLMAHCRLRLDRVEPSYRFRHFMDYPAIGLNVVSGAPLRMKA